MFDLSLTAGDDYFPLHVQDQELMHAYVATLQKVSDRIDYVLTGPYEPLRDVPAIPAGDL